MSDRTLRDFLSYTDSQLAVTDPLDMNLLVAKEIASLQKLDVLHYKRMADQWAAAIKKEIHQGEAQFNASPRQWKNDIHFFRLGVMCWYVDEVLKIRYRADQKDLQSVFYTEPSDLFLNGVMDTRHGTCANMAALHVALGWRLRWPVSLACVGSHLILRYDDGKVTHNIEATNTGKGGFHSHPDEYYIQKHRLPEIAIRCGSDLRALTAREVLGEFIGLRGRHYEDTQLHDSAEKDFLLARYLFPRSRYLQYAQVQASVQNGMNLFEPGERGHPTEMLDWLQKVVAQEPWNTRKMEHGHASHQKYTYELSGKQN